MAIWRNGRLEGLKILWAEMPVWVRIPLPLPFFIQFLWEKRNPKPKK